MNDYFEDLDIFDDSNKDDDEEESLSLNEKRLNTRRKIEDYLKMKRLREVLDGYDYINYQ